METKVSRRDFLKTSGLVAVSSQAAQAPTVASPAQSAPEAPFPHRTQFDPQLLRGSQGRGLAIASSSGRQLCCDGQNRLITGLAWTGPNPILRVWRDREIVAEHPLSGPPCAPVLLANDQDAEIWISAGELVYRIPAIGQEPAAVGLRGLLQDGCRLPNGQVLLALLEDGKLTLCVFDKSGSKIGVIDDGAGRASLDMDSSGALHLVYEKRQGLEYRRFDAGSDLVKTPASRQERIAEAFGSYPAVLSFRNSLLVGYLGESCRLPSQVSGSAAWERLGRGGYVAVLVAKGNGWERHRLADSRQIVKPLRPVDAAYSGGNTVEMLTAVEEFGPPSFGIGPDGGVQVLWANNTRRWIYGARFLGSGFSETFEVRGPLEKLSGPTPSLRSPFPQHGGLPLLILTASRAYLDDIAVPAVAVHKGRKIDFVQWDDVSQAEGLEVTVNQLKRRDENPVIPVGKPGEIDDAAVVADVSREDDRWRANIAYITATNADPNTKDRGWRWDGRATSPDGIHWTKLPPEPLNKRYSIAGVGSYFYTIRYLEDLNEKNRAWRFKGLWRSPDHEPWGYLAVVSDDGVNWVRVPDNQTIIRADDDLRVRIDPDDVPERRFKASSISRSFCGRICAQWTSPDGMHWNDERDTLDFKDPFGARPDRGSTGRILLDSWSGPDEEDEIHGGYVFRDGERWLLHYMKWTYDGHIYCGLASSRDGINFSRVGRGAITLPLGDPGTWDAGRVALREAPFLVDGVWRQYYTGCGWKHGLGGVGAKTSHFGLNAPNQMGVAEIQAGHWTCLQVKRGRETGELRSNALELKRAHELTLDILGVAAPGEAIQCAIFDGEGVPIRDFGYEACDSISKNGTAVPVFWRGRSLASLGARQIRIGVRLVGYRVQLFGLRLEAGS